jgi:hypothetical protein
MTSNGLERERFWSNRGTIPASGGTEENHETTVSISEVPVEVRIEHLSNRSRKLYRYLNTLGPTAIGDDVNF